MKNSHFWSGRTVRENFDKHWKLNTLTDCHEWLASKSLGYGQLNIGGRPESAHRFIWRKISGDIPAGLHVLHRCDNRACVNVEHLFLGTNQDNISDKQRKKRGRGPSLSGSSHPLAKLTREFVDAIRSRYAAGGISQRRLGMEYGVSQTHIRYLVSGKGWARDGQQHFDRYRARRRRVTVADAFDKYWKRDDSSGCWLWQRALSDSGHGKVSLRGRKIGAHKFSYERIHGLVPDGLVVRHTCDNASCVNPEHLKLGSQADNVYDMVRRGRAKGVSGEQHPNSKLTLLQVQEIRRRVGLGETRTALATAFGVRATNVSQIALGRTWKTEAVCP